MMHDALARWLKSPGTDRIASVHAASVDDVALLVLALRDARVLLVGKRPLCDQIAMRAILDGAVKPQIGISRGLVKDLSTIEAADRDQTVVLQTRIVFDHLIDARRRMAQTLRMLGGYDIEAGAWEPGIERQLTDRLKTFARRRSGGTVLADHVTSRVSTRLWPSAPVFQVAIAVGTADPDGAGDVDYIAGETEPQITPTLELVAAHGRWLATTDPDALATMHASVATADFDDVFAVWRSNLSIIAAQAGNDGSAGQGLQRLVEMQRRFAQRPPG